ncbi:MAG: hypothetical protein IEMM0008_0884 [bacterium]|nr:MAG: hypothetical protein IEMM0008_0884 [bacterium]
MKVTRKNMILIIGTVLLIGISAWQVTVHWDDIIGSEDDDLELLSGTDTEGMTSKTPHTNKHKNMSMDKTDSPGQAKRAKPKIILKLKEFTLAQKSQTLSGLRTEKVSVRKDTITLHFTGKLDYNQDTLSYITPRQRGIVRNIYKYVGDSVGPGENLLRSESTQLGKAQQDYLNSKALMKEAEKNYRRAEYLYQKRIISEIEYLKAQSDYRVHKNNVLSWENELRLLGYTDSYLLESYNSIDPFIELKSPINGRIIERYANLGEMITPMKSAYKIADLSNLWLFLDVYEKDFRYLRIGQKVAFTPTSYPERKFYGTIDYLNSEVMGKSRTIRVRALVQNKDWRLLPNMYVRVRLKISSNKMELMVPSSAVIDSGTRKIIFVHKGKDKFQPRLVTLGRRINDYRVVYKVDLPKQIGMARFEKDILKKISSKKISEDENKKYLLKYYLKDSNRKLYTLKKDLQKEERIKIANILRSVKYIKLEGVEEGEFVVVSANFLLDSESQLKRYIEEVEEGMKSSASAPKHHH